MIKLIRILNLGAGVQSTTLCIMAQMNAEAVAAGLPMPYPLVGIVEFSIFGDTGDEPWKVYLHLCWLVQRCFSIRFLIRSIDLKRNRILKKLFPFSGPVNIERARRYLAWLRRIEQGTLRGSLKKGVNSTGQRFASIPAFTWDGISLKMTRAGHKPDEGKLRRQCTSEWKIDCVERAIRYEIMGLSPGDRLVGLAHFVQVFGLSYDEPSRIIKVRRNFQTISWATPEFPLSEMEQTRGGCKTWLRKHGPPYEVARSACSHCQLHDNDEWRNQRDNDPEVFEEACVVDETLRMDGVIVNRKMDGMLFLHRSCKPLREAPIDEPDSRKLQEVLGFKTECEGMCGV